MRDHGLLKLRELKDTTLTLLLCFDVELSTSVTVYKAITSDTVMLVHVGDFVKYSDGTVEVCIHEWIILRFHFSTLCRMRSACCFHVSRSWRVVTLTA